MRKIHRILSFKQKAWMRPFIDFATKQRAMATSTVDKDRFKLSVNSTFGRLCLNLRKQIDVRLVVTKEQCRQYVAKPTYESHTIINEELVMIHMKKASIHWNKPTYAGFSILDLSKVHMYRMHYDVMLPVYGKRAKLLFTDTDSLCYELSTEDYYQDICGMMDLFDTSNFPKDHKCYSSKNCKVLGKFKEECAEVAPDQFVGLRAKMYSLKMPHDKDKSTAKGVKASYAKNHIRHRDYFRCLMEQVKTGASFYCIRSFNHQLKTVQIKKDALNPYDDKRYLLQNSTDTLAYGHYSLRS